MSTLYVDVENSAELMEVFARAPSVARKAIMSATRKMATQMKSKVAGAEARAHGFPIPPLLKVRTKTGRSAEAQATVWFGYNPIGAEYVGKVTAVTGAFFATMKSGHEGWWVKVPGTWHVAESGRFQEKIEEARVPMPHAIEAAQGVAEAFGLEAQHYIEAELTRLLLT